MGPDLKLTENSKASKKKVSVAQNQENNKVNFSECMNSVEPEMIDVECEDVTEYSSSFGDTESGDENGLVENDEVQSPSCEPNLFGPLRLGKKRLTDDWKRFIHPLAWRCKWLEIKLCEFKSQAVKYERELAKHGQSKQFEFEMVTFEGFDANLQSFPSKIQQKEVMNRKKRKRVEDTTDVASYMLHHNIFSYYESKKSAAASALTEYCGDLDNKTSDNYDDLGCNDGCPFQSRDADNLTEEILRKIEGLQLRIRIIKARIDKMVNENPQKFSSINILSSRVPSSAILNNSGNHPYDEKEDRTIMQCSTSQHASEVNMWDNFIPESAVSGDSEVASPRDMLRTMSQRLLEISSENIESEILIPNQAANEFYNFGSAITLQAEKPRVSMEKLKTVSLVNVPPDNLHVNTSLQSNA